MQAQFEAVGSGGEETIRVLQIDCEDGFDGHWHYHPECEATYIRDGAGQRMVGDHLAEFRPGEIVLLGPELPHFWRTAPDYVGRSRATVAQFRDAMILGQSAVPRELAPLAGLLRSASRGLVVHGGSNRVHAAFDRLSEAKPGGWESYQAWIALLGTIADQRASGKTRCLASAGFHPRAHRDPRLARVIAYIYRETDAADSGPSFAGACAAAAMTPAAFSRFFKRQTGRSYSWFVNETKVAAACRRLQETDDTILAISMESGFHSLSHFNRVFARLKGRSPGAWRRRVQSA